MRLSRLLVNSQMGSQAPQLSLRTGTLPRHKDGVVCNSSSAHGSQWLLRQHAVRLTMPPSPAKGNSQTQAFGCSDPAVGTRKRARGAGGGVFLFAWEALPLNSHSLHHVLWLLPFLCNQPPFPFFGQIICPLPAPVSRLICRSCANQED